MSGLRDLYRQVILDHTKRPRNFGPLELANREAEGHNPLCGDRIKVAVRVADERIEDIRFEGTGCAISTASASLMTEALKGKSLADADRLFEGFHALLTGDGNPELSPGDLGKLQVFDGVREFPMRVKCATLAWHTVRAALRQSERTVTTE